MWRTRSINEGIGAGQDLTEEYPTQPHTEKVFEKFIQ